MEKKSVAIIGLGLLGTSLGIALRNSGWHRSGWTRNSDNLRRAIQDNVIDTAADSTEAAAANAQITVLCMPVTDIICRIAELANVIRPNCILTDVGSAKGLIMSEAETAFQNAAGMFIGSHPMAGTEYSGYDAGIADLYVRAPVFITPGSRATPEGIEMLCDFWRTVRANPEVIDPKRHDVIVAHTSHISHIMASTLARTVLDCPENEKQCWYDGCAGGFRDTTRIASSSPHMWRTIIEQNRTEVLHAMRRFEEKWIEMRTMIETCDFDAFEEAFADGRDKRDAWLEYRYRQT